MHHTHDIEVASGGIERHWCMAGGHQRKSHVRLVVIQRIEIATRLKSWRYGLRIGAGGSEFVGVDWKGLGWGGAQPNVLFYRPLLDGIDRFTRLSIEQEKVPIRAHRCECFAASSVHSYGV